MNSIVFKSYFNIINDIVIPQYLTGIPSRTVQVAVLLLYAPMAYNFTRKLKSLRFMSPYEKIIVERKKQHSIQILQTTNLQKRYRK